MKKPWKLKGAFLYIGLATMYRALYEASFLTAESHRPRGFVALCLVTMRRYTDGTTITKHMVAELIQYILLETRKGVALSYAPAQMAI